MHRFESLPNEFRAWLRGIPKERVHALLQNSIERRAAQRGLTIEPANLLTAINKLDERYFSADKEGRKAQASEFFKQARMLAALQFSLDGTEEDALYEYFHSLDVDTSEAAIAELEND